KNDKYVVAHSQGSLIVNSAANHYNLNDKNILYLGTPLYREFNNGETINSRLDPIHNPLIVFNPDSWKKNYDELLPILYDHTNSFRYKDAINNIKDK
ncbi:hypothetical protein O6B98_09380, partial [Campylobacter ureolyticus]